MGRRTMPDRVTIRVDVLPVELLTEVSLHYARHHERLDLVRAIDQLRRATVTRAGFAAEREALLDMAASALDAVHQIDRHTAGHATTSRAGHPTPVAIHDEGNRA